MVGDILSDDMHEFLPLNRLLRRAESARLEVQIVNQRHGLEDTINVAQALDNGMGFVRVQLVGRLVNGRASFQEVLPGFGDISGVALHLRACWYSNQ